LAGGSLYRFTEAQRLPDATAFGRVFKKATRSQDKWFTVLSRQNDKDTARLGLAISKKHCRRATARKRIKRVVRESFRHHRGSLAGLDIVVINQSPAGSARNEQLFESLSAHWAHCRESGLDKGGQE
jgi:ribonuclease P protein component